MNREEINEALKLVKEPITVNCVEYKYFDRENYEKLLSVYENCRWFVDNYEQALQIIENLQQELQRKDNIINEMKKLLEDDVNDYNGDIDIETRNIDSEFMRGISWEAQYILDKIKELEEK